jgi:hypothetical protein
MKYLLERIKNPGWVEITISVVVTILLGNLTGEVVSRDYNSYFQGFLMFLSLCSGILSIRIVATWVNNYVTSNEK